MFEMAKVLEEYVKNLPVQIDIRKLVDDFLEEREAKLTKEEQDAIRDDNHYFIDHEDESDQLYIGTLIMFVVFICVVVCL